VPRLTHEVRSEIVRRLACFEKPAEIVRWLKAELDMDVDIQKVLYHDPTRVNGRDLGANWRVIFETARKGFLTNVETVPIANQGYRLAMLDMLFNDAVKAKNKIEARSCLEQAAKEIGGIYSNVRTLNTPDLTKPTGEIPAHEREQQLADLMDKALGRMKTIEGKPAPKT
jgi:hypothetical protein